MSRIRRIRARNVGFSRAPTTLRRNLASNASLFEDFESKPGGWFGSVFCTLVEVETEDGAVGVGTAGAFGGAAKSIVEQYLADLVVGLDCRAHEALWQRMYRTLVRFGRRGPAVTALSAVDIACWDAHGREDGRSVVELLGGRAQTSVPAYVSRLYALEDLDELADEARGYIGQGFTRLKQRFGFGPRDGAAGMRRNLELVRTVREAAGEDVELAADAYMGWDVGYAVEMAERLRDFSLSWRPLGCIVLAPDAAVERIVATWPAATAFARAAALGLAQDAGIDSIVREFMDDYLDDAPPARH